MGLPLLPFLRGTATVLESRICRAVNRPARPRLVAYQVTQRCNLRCPHCVYRSPDSKSSPPPVPELTVPEISRIFSDPGLHRLDLIRITGGEPLLREDLSPLILSIKTAANPRIFYLTTNGSFPDRLQDLLAEILPRDTKIHLLLSIDGIGEEHDRVRGVPGTFRKIERSIEIIQRFRKTYPFFVGINHTLVGDNLDRYREVEELSRKLGFSYRRVVAARYSENTGVDQDPLKKPLPFLAAFDLEKPVFSEIYRRIFDSAQTSPPVASPRGKNGKISAAGWATSASLWRLGHMYLLEGEANRLLANLNSPRFSCCSLFTHFRLLPDGKIIPCSGLPREIGDVREATFSEIWRSARADAGRKLVKNCRGCWIECDVMPSAFYSGSIIPWLLGRRVKAYKFPDGLRSPAPEN